jgi:hypothetical protein
MVGDTEVLQKKTEQALNAINDFNGTTYLKRARNYLERDRDVRTWLIPSKSSQT